MKRRNFTISGLSFLGLSALFPEKTFGQSGSTDVSRPYVLFDRPDPSKFIRFNFDGSLVDIDNFDDSIFHTIDRLGVKDIEVTEAGFDRLLSKLRLSLLSQNKESFFVWRNSNSTFLWSKRLTFDSGAYADVSVSVSTVSSDVAQKRRLTDNHMFLRFREKVYDSDTKWVV